MSETPEWYVAVQGQQQGPMSEAEVVSGIEGGRFDRGTHVFKQGMAGWEPITSRAQFAAAFGGAAAAPPPLPAAQHAHEIDYEIFGEEMQFVEITLDPNEACIAEAGAFIFMDPGIQMQTIFGDGSGRDEGSGLMGKLLGAGKRVLTGESLFMTLFGNTASKRQKVAFARTLRSSRSRWSSTSSASSRSSRARAVAACCSRSRCAYSTSRCCAWPTAWCAADSRISWTQTTPPSATIAPAAARPIHPTMVPNPR